MSRKLNAESLLTQLRQDPRLRVIPPAARFLWLALADTVMRLAQSGAFVVGSRIGTADDMAAVFAMSKPEVETQLGFLLETQAVTQREDGAWVIPDAIAASAQMSRSAENGRKSLGRPRKNEDRDQYRLRLLARVNGGSESSKLKPDDNPPRVGVRAASFLPSKINSFTKEKEGCLTRDSVTQLVVQLSRIAGIEPEPNIAAGLVKTWLRDGATVDQLVETITKVAERTTYRPPANIAYFNPRIRELIDQQAEPTQTVSVNPHLALARKQFTEELERFQDQGCYGEMPRSLEVRLAEMSRMAA